MLMSADDFCRLAADLAEEHGIVACDYARRAVHAFEAEGEADRAKFWFVLSVLLDDIVYGRLDPEQKLTIH